jgi:hypothetical protein
MVGSQRERALRHVLPHCNSRLKDEVGRWEGRGDEVKEE